MALKEYLNKNDQFAAYSGIKITEIEEGRSKAVMKIEKHHLNAGRVCQGGAIFTLADLALAAVMNSHGQLTLSIESTIAFHQSAVEGDTLTAEAAETFNHQKIPHYEVKIYNQHRQLICTFTAIAYRKKVSFPFEGSV